MLLCTLAQWTHVVHAAPETCAGLFQTKRYPRAGSCFERRANAIKRPSASSLTKTQQTAKGRLLRNAALAYTRAAEGSRDLSKAAYYREQALRVLSTYLIQRLHETKYRKKSAIVEIYKLRSRLQYAFLTVVTGQSDAAIQITGFRWRKRAQGKLSAKLRPGRYQVTVHYPTHKRIQRQLMLSPKKTEILVLTPPGTKAATAAPRRRPASPRATPRAHPVRGPLSWSLWVVGGLSVIAGVTLFGVARGLEQQRLDAHANATRQLDQQTPADTKALGALLTSHRETAATLQPWGLGLSIAGLTLATGGVVAWLVLRRAPLAAKPPPAAAPVGATQLLGPIPKEAS